MGSNDSLRELRLNATRILRMLSPEFQFEPGEDVDLDDSFRDAARELAMGFVAIDAQMQKRNVPDAWKGPDVPPPPPQTREQMVETLRITAKALGYRLVLHPPTSKKTPA